MLVASLHQGISDLMPSRLEFYENWLNPAGMRNGKIGLAPLAAVLSFLRQEGEPYALVTSRAGEYAAQWTYDNLTPVERSIIRALPVTLRARMAMHLAKKVVRRSYGGSRAVTKLRRGQGTLTLRSSIFCAVREPFDWPLCVFYAAALSHLFALVGVSGEVRVRACQGIGDQSCVIAVNVPLEQR
jgi:predicted hydrocarbon binding protein